MRQYHVHFYAGQAYVASADWLTVWGYEAWCAYEAHSLYSFPFIAPLALLAQYYGCFMGAISPMPLLLYAS